MKKLKDSEETILTLEDFKETQSLIDEFRGMGDKISNLENEIALNKTDMNKKIKDLRGENKDKVTLLEKRIQIIEEKEFEQEWQDAEFNMNTKELKAEFEKKKQEDVKSVQDQIKEENAKLKAENKAIKVEYDNKNKNAEQEIAKLADDKKYFRTDAHIKTITMEIESMKKEIQKQELMLKKKDIELQEFYQEEKHEDPLKWQKIYNEQDELKNNIKELTGKIEEYSNFKEELLSINLTPDEYKKMYEREEQGHEEPTPEVQQTSGAQPTPGAQSTAGQKSQPTPGVQSTAGQKSQPTRGAQQTPGQKPQSAGGSKEKPLKITIGKNGKLEYDGKEYAIDTNTIIKGMNLYRKHNECQFNHNTKKETLIKEGFPEDIADLVNEVSPNTPIDYGSMLAILKSGMRQAEKYSLITGYVTNVLKSQSEAKLAFGKTLSEKDIQYGRANRSDIDIIYDMKSLKPTLKDLFPFSKNPRHNNLTGEEKEIMAQLANKANRYGIGKAEGQYKTGIVARIFGVFKKNKELLPEASEMIIKDASNQKSIEAEIKAATKFNEVYDKNDIPKDKTKREEFIQGLYTKGEGLKDDALYEYEDIVYEQTKQDMNKKRTFQINKQKVANEYAKKYGGRYQEQDGATTQKDDNEPEL